MRILDKYIGLSVAYSTFFVMLVLVSLFTFFTFAGELNKTGKGTYDSLQAVQFALLTIPSMLYQMFPTAALIGTMSGLGMLANNSELVAMRAAGYSLKYILRSVFIFSFILMLVVVIVGEYLAPASQIYAETKRSLAMSGQKAIQTSEGVWLKDGMRYIQVGKLGNDGVLEDVHIFELDEKQKMISLKQINSALNIQNNNWLLSGFDSFAINNGNILIDHQDTATESAFISSDVLSLVAVKPESMSAQAAYQYIDYLEKNGVDASHYKQTFWMKIATPFSTFIMVMLAIPIVLGSIRTMTAGHRILIGTLTGIGFYLITQVFAYIGLVFEFPPMATAFVPLIVFFMIALRLMKGVR